MRMQKVLMWGCVGVMVAFGLVYIGREAGSSAADQDIERMQLLWPYVLDMPQSDRALLAGLALSCRLHTKDKEAVAVVACLREAARDPGAMRPKGVSQIEVSDRLERLLSLSEKKP